MSVLDGIKFDKTGDGLVPAIVQDASTKDVLMLGFMNREALDITVRSGKVTFWKRTSQKLWTKGETSGNILKFVALRVNCNDDSLLILAEPVGATCHTGHPTCYFREANDSAVEWRTITEQQFDPDTVYGPK
jgi:phosphoribosyl-ATP pyrophosphohydrolase/phosphoribosyl-AMP cyclohydrolase